MQNLQAANLELVLKTPEQVQAWIEGMAPDEKAELSADWLALVEAAPSANPWVHGFDMVHRRDGVVVGGCGFKGPPTSEGAVEIAYGVAPEHQGKGYATEAAEALVRFAFQNDAVRLVRAHTLPEMNASTRVLNKCGFRHVGEVMDPDDGRVWRWEKEGKER